MDEDTIDSMILSQGKDIVENISISYLSDRNKEKTHLLPGEGSYNLSKILQTLKQHNYI